MKRLTKPDSKYTDFKNHRLQQYEETGLTPEEIKSLYHDAGLSLAIRIRDLEAENKDLRAVNDRLKEFDDEAIKKGQAILDERDKLRAENARLQMQIMDHENDWRCLPMANYYEQCKCGAYCQEEPCYDCLKKDNEKLREMARAGKSLVTTYITENQDLRAQLTDTQAALAEVVEALKELAYSPVVFADDRIRYVEMQVDKDALEQAKQALEASDG